MVRPALAALIWRSWRLRGAPGRGGAGGLPPGRRQAAVRPRQRAAAAGQRRAHRCARDCRTRCRPHPPPPTARPRRPQVRSMNTDPLRASCSAPEEVRGRRGCTPLAGGCVASYRPAPAVDAFTVHTQQRAPAPLAPAANRAQSLRQGLGGAPGRGAGAHGVAQAGGPGARRRHGGALLDVLERPRRLRRARRGTRRRRAAAAEAQARQAGCARARGSGGGGGRRGTRRFARALAAPRRASPPRPGPAQT